MSKLFPSIIPDSDEPYVDTTYNRGELERKDYDELRQIAAEHESEEVNGRMSKSELIEGLTGLERV